MDAREEAKLKWLRRNMPIVAAAMAAVTFVLIALAGHGGAKALLVAAIMFAFAIVSWKLREWFGVYGFIAIASAAAFLLWRAQENGWL